MSPAITVRGLGKHFRLGHQIHNTLRDQIAGWFKRRDPGATEEFWALKDVSFDVHRGEVMGVIGRNGAGKSTLLKILSQITDPTEGEVRIRGRVASLLEVGTGFHPELSGRENVFLNGAILGMSRREIRSKFDEIVEFAEVAKFIDTAVKHYSSGMYVRLAFAVAAHLESEILIVDEVLAVGDASFQTKCLRKMHEASLDTGRTVLFVSHNLAAVQRLCTAGVFLQHGRVAAHGPMGAVIEQYQRSLESPQSDSTDRLASLRAGEARYIGWEFRSPEGNSLHTCRTGATCEFRLTLVSRLDCDDITIGFVLWNADGEIMVSGNTHTNRMPLLRISEGRYTVDVRVRLPIKAGLYQIDVSLNSKSKGQLDRAFLEPRVHVLPPEHTVSEQWQGILTEPLQFDLAPVP